MKRNMAAFTVIVLMMTFFAAGCATMPQGKSFTDMSPKEKATYFYGIYNRQYSDYMSQVGYAKQGEEWVKVSDPELSDELKDILKTKKNLLSQVYPLIQLYDNQLQFNGTPSPATEQQIYDLLNKLQ